MIYGNAVMLGGGGGGITTTDAILRVQAPAGSTVTINKGTVTKTDLGHENADDNSVYDYYFIIHASQFDSQNAWTVTATLSGDTASDTIIIDSANEYDVMLRYWNGELYDAGNQYTSVTGGWDVTKNNNMSCSFNSNNIAFNYSGNYAHGIIATANKISINDFNTLYATFSVTNHGSNGNISFGISNIQATDDTSFVAYTKDTSTGSKTISVDISAYNGDYYVVLSDYWSTATVTKMWME